jgi:hypothetical protein
MRVRGETIIMVIGVFVDDLLVTGNGKSAIDKVEESLIKIILKNIWELKYHIWMIQRCCFIKQL